MDSNIKTIIFDLGKVLIDFDHRIAVRKMIKLSGKSADDIFNLFFDSPLTKEFEEGMISPEEFFLQVKQALGLKISYEEFLPIWNEIFSFNEENRAIYELAGKLKECYKTVLLTNINILHFDYLKNNFDIFTPFDYIITSFELKVRKPDPKIYQETLRIIGNSPEEVFYTDDRPELIVSARDLGINAFVFKGSKQLKIDLISAGINLDGNSLICPANS